MLLRDATAGISEPERPRKPNGISNETGAAIYNMATPVLLRRNCPRRNGHGALPACAPRSARNRSRNNAAAFVNTVYRFHTK